MSELCPLTCSRGVSIMQGVKPERYRVAVQGLSQVCGTLECGDCGVNCATTRGIRPVDIATKVMVLMPDSNQNQATIPDNWGSESDGQGGPEEDEQIF